MSASTPTTPQFFSYPGFGTSVKRETHYSTSMLLPAGPTIHISGQGGWTTSSFPPSIAPSIAEEVAQAFRNVDVALKDAGGKGMQQVYKFVMYSAPGMNHAVAEEAVRQLKEWFTDEEKLPLLTFVGVAELYIPEMHIEIEASAFVG